jgi:hypothetical protein
MYLRLRKPPLWELPYMALYGLSMILEGVVSLLSLGCVSIGASLWVAKNLSIKRLARRSK